MSKEKEETKETKHTNLDEAKRSLESIIRLAKSGDIFPDNKSLPFNFEIIRSRALIAIAEQLRVANLIALTNVGDTDLSFPAFGALVDDWKVSKPNHSVNADIAAILGLGDDHE